MSVFTYRAINEENKEVHGQVDAPDLNSAKQALQSTHLEVVEIHEASRSNGVSSNQDPQGQPVLKTTFAFEGTDSARNVRRGTLQAETKYQAFERLKHDQKLFVTMLSPLGVTPQYRDHDLENWQRQEIEEKKAPPVLPQQGSLVTQAPAMKNSAGDKPAKSIRFTIADAPKSLSSIPAVPQSQEAARVYHPLASTFRVYAGWLLAWYGLFVALGYYAHERSLSWNLPFVEAFFLSPLIFSFVIAIFLFLFLGSIHRVICGHWISRIVLGLLGIGAFAGVRMSVF